MNLGKNRCKYLKEVRQRIADENGIPLQQHECTFKGECSGTCPFCEAELLYLETELQKRRKLGKAVAVAGIALSSVMMSSCYTPSQCTPSGSGLRGYSPPSFVTSKDSTDLSTQRAELEEHFNGTVGAIDGTITSVRGQRDGAGSADNVARFPATYSPPADWLKQRLRDYSSYMANELPDDVVIIFFQNPDGSVWGEDLINMPRTGSEQEFAFLNEVRRQVLAMPRWEPATCHGEPVITPDGEINATFYTISIQELRP